MGSTTRSSGLRSVSIRCKSFWIRLATGEAPDLRQLTDTKHETELTTRLDVGYFLILLRQAMSSVWTVPPLGTASAENQKGCDLARWPGLVVTKHRIKMSNLARWIGFCSSYKDAAKCPFSGSFIFLLFRCLNPGYSLPSPVRGVTEGTPGGSTVGTSADMDARRAMTLKATPYGLW